MRKRQASKWAAMKRSFQLEVPIITLKSCLQLSPGESLHVQGFANKPDSVAEEVKLSVEKSENSVFFELKAASSGKKFDAFLHDCWKCIIPDTSEDATELVIPVGNETVGDESIPREGSQVGEDASTNDVEEPIHVDDGLTLDLDDDMITYDGQVHVLAEENQDLDSLNEPQPQLGVIKEEIDFNHQNKVIVESDVEEVTMEPLTPICIVAESEMSKSKDKVIVTAVLDQFETDLHTKNGKDIPDGEQSDKIILHPTVDNYVCRYCRKSYSTSKTPQKSLTFHETWCKKKSTNTGVDVKPTIIRLVKCDICSAKFQNSTFLKMHIERIHKRKRTAQKLNQCLYCEKCFGSRIAKHRHQMFVCRMNPEVIKPHTCKVCRYPFRTEPELQAHIAKKHGDQQIPDKIVSCDQCDMMFRRTNSLYAHKVSAHNMRQAKFKCEFCAKSFHFRDRYNMHIATHSDERPCLCPTCGKAFKNRDQLMKHRNRIHLDKWPYRCEKCGHGVDMEKKLLKHQCGRSRRNPDGSHKPNKYPRKELKEVRAPREPTSPDSSPTHDAKRRRVSFQCNVKQENPDMPKVTCPICQKLRKNNDALLKHIHLTHRDHPQYQTEYDKLRDIVKVTCDLCMKVFSSKRTLIDHHHSVHETLESACEQCNKVFRTPTHLKAHMKNVHDDVRFTCDQCPRVFKSRKNLQCHFHYHHTELDRKYKCDSCDFRYAFEKQYYEHRTRVHGPKNQACPWCNYKCSTRWYMKKHMANCSKGRRRPQGNAQIAMGEVAHGVETLSQEPFPLEEVTEALMRLEQPGIDTKQLLVQLAADNLLSDQTLMSEDGVENQIEHLDHTAIVELPASWNERTVPENVSVESIMRATDDNNVLVQQESVVANHYQEFRVTQTDGSEHIIQLIYHDQPK